MPKTDLEGALEQKQIQYDQLIPKLELLTSTPIEVSYDLNLTQEFQIKLAKQGLYSLTRDLLYYKRNYDNSEL